MVEDGLVIKRSDPKDGRIHYFRTNPQIIQSLVKNEIYHKDDGEAFEIPLTMLERFFMWLEETYHEEDRKTPFIKALETVRVLDYITFLMFLRKRAIDWEKFPDVEEGLTSRLKLSDLIEEYITELEKIEALKLEPADLLSKKKSLEKFINGFSDPRDLNI